MKLFLDEPRQRRAVAAVEFAVVLPFLMIFVIGILEVGRMIEVQQILTNAAREGGRQSSTGQLTDSDVQTVVKNYLTEHGLPGANATVTVTNLGFPGNTAPVDNNPVNATDLDQIKVEVSVKFSDVSWTKFFRFIDKTTGSITGTVIWSSMKDKAFPVPTPPKAY